MSDLLVEIALDNGTLYYSIHGTSTSTAYYEGRITGIDSLKRTIRPGGGVSAIQTIGFELADQDGTLRTLHENQTFKRRAVTVKLVDDEDNAVTTQFVGVVESVAVTPDLLQIEARDDSWDVLTEKVPLRVFPDIFGDMPITTPVALIPIVIGTVSSTSFESRGSIPAYLVDPSVTAAKYRYVAAQHPLKSITKVYSRGNEVPSGDWTTTYVDTTTSYGTVRMTYIDVDYDLRDENGVDDVTYDATGITDDNLESGNLETDIPDSLKLVLSNLDQTSPLVAADFASTTTVNAQYTAQSISLSNNGLAVTEWGMTWLDVVDMFAESFNLQFFVNSSGKFKMRFDDAQTGTSTKTYFDSQDIIQGSFSIDSPSDNVSTLECSYAYDFARGRFTARKSYNDATEQTALGRNIEEEAELHGIRSINDAQKIAQIRLFQQRSSRDVVSFRIPAKSYLELGDFVSVTHWAGPSSNNVGYDETLFCIYELNLTVDGNGLFHDLLLIDHPGLTVGSPADSEETRTTQTLSQRSPDIASDVVWTSTDADTVAWSANDLKIGDALYETISSSNTGNMSAKTYVYFDPDTSESTYQVTTTFSSAVGGRKVLLAECVNGTNSAKIKNYVGWVETGVGGGGSDMPNQVTEDEITTPDLGSINADLGSITAGTVTGATIRTAASGARIQLTSSALEVYDASVKRIDIPTTADRINFYHTGSLNGFFQGSDGVGGIACFGNLAALDSGNGIRLVGGGDGTAGIDAFGGCTYLTVYGNLLPSSTGTDLGGSSNRWDLYGETIYAYGNIQPSSDDSGSVGTASVAFGNVYANEGDFDYLDTIDLGSLLWKCPTRPDTDDSYNFGHPDYRWSTIYCTTLTEGDIEFANGWNIRELGLRDENRNKSFGWIRKHHPDGLQISDQSGKLVLVIHGNGNLYVSGKILPMNELP